MDSDGIMTEAEIHDFGTEIVLGQLQKEGYEIVAVDTKIGVNPQIFAKKEGRDAFIVVRTACYPKTGQLEEIVHFQMIEHAKKHNATPYFASVSIARADGETEGEASVPVRGAGFYGIYKGLGIITDSEHVKVWDGNELRDI